MAAPVSCFRISETDEEEHSEHLKMVFERFQQYGLRINISKSVMGADQVECLGFLITGEVSRPLPEKVQAISNYKLPETIHDLRTFLVFPLSTTYGPTVSQTGNFKERIVEFGNSSFCELVEYVPKRKNSPATMEVESYLDDYDNPKTNEAAKSNNSTNWKKAKESELNLLRGKHTWNLIDL
ncbi:retrovirus-related Pol polyprotein from transposon opus [Trichonephila clavipes]|uniref:Retrovirus-related Pol polyprotein from transposon opus n=1 Tax=Trichonephila clavipes TaxID=2585209 RepID=A0A8X6RNV5_TRICX|nr:retrovirus-related Pol polyprotein from transposon opus [Trichonephila clavipes]